VNPLQPALPPAVEDPDTRRFIDGLATPAQEQPADPAAAALLSSLREQLRDTLREREAELRQQYIDGRATLYDLLRASDDVFQSELALVNGSQERTDLWNRYIANLQSFEARVEPFVQAGGGRLTRADLLALKSFRIKAQIGLAAESRPATAGALPKSSGIGY
jgi:hypothetical protein